MDIESYIQDNGRLHTFENVPERDDQSSFFDDIDERNAIHEVISDRDNAHPPPNVGAHLTKDRSFTLLDPEAEEAEVVREISVYALDQVQSI